MKHPVEYILVEDTTHLRWRCSPCWPDYTPHPVGDHFAKTGQEAFVQAYSSVRAYEHARKKREKVYAVLDDATEPLTVGEISRRSGEEIEEVRRMVNILLDMGSLRESAKSSLMFQRVR